MFGLGIKIRGSKSIHNNTLKMNQPQIYGGLGFY